MPRRPNAPREPPGKYGALARDVESGVRGAWTSADADAPTPTATGGRKDGDAEGTDVDAGAAREGRKRASRRKLRPPPPTTAPKQKLWKRVVGFFYDNLWIAFVAYVLGAVVALRELPGEGFMDPTDAVYFVAISATTVGYGDMSPKTDAGKVFVMGLLITGVALAGVAMSKVTDWILKAQERAMNAVMERSRARMDADMATLRAQVGANAGVGVDAAMKAPPTKAERAPKAKFSPLAQAAVAIVFVVSLGAVVMHRLEDISFLDGCYWSIVTSTTVGYGDVTPKTREGKIFASVYCFITVGVMAWAIGQVASSSVESEVEKHSKLKEFKLTPEWLASQGGEKGYVDSSDFLKAMLLAMGKCEQSDFDTINSRFKELDVNGDQTLDAKDLLGA
jgi:potassium channel subfamily K